VIRLESAGPVATIGIERPERRNALNLDAVVALDDALEQVLEGTTSGTVRCLVLTGSDGHFCAGADLKELEDLTFTQRLRIMLDHLAELPIPVIAAISGSCMGLGMQLALACDVRVATEDARFAVPVAKLGLMVDHWTLARLDAAFGPGAARHLVLTAEVLDTEAAHRLGFVQQIGDLAAAAELAARVTTLAPLSLAGSKLGLNLVERHHREPAYEEAFGRAWASEDLVEGRLAFSERRAPQFRGR
jgi:enoyl-CoA hydratase